MRRVGLIIAALVLTGGVARAQRTGVGEAQADTERCKKLVEDSEYAKAEQACLQALRKDAGYVDAWKLYLPTLIAEHKEDKAIAEAERAETTLGITDASVLAYHGAAILSAAARPAVDPKTQQPNKWAKQQARALPYLERSVALDSNQPVAQALLCTYWTTEPQYMDRSQASCQAALRTQPNNADLLDSQAWIYYNHKSYADAQTAAEQVLRTKPIKAQMEMKAKIVIGLSQADRGDCAGARRTLEPIQKYARNGGWVIDRGLTVCAQTQQEADRYSAEYMRGAANDPRGPLSHAIAYRHLSDKKRGGDASLLGGALSDLARAKQLANQLADAKRKREIVRDATRARAEILSQLGRYAEAEDEWKPIYEEEGAGNPDTVLGYGVASRKALHLKVAQRVLEQGVKRNPDNSAIKFELGRTLVEALDLTAGIKDMESALSAEEGKDLARKNEFVNVLTRVGVDMATKGGKPKEAEVLLEKAVKYDATSVLANRDLGLVRLQQHKYAEAIGPLQVWKQKMGGKDRDSNLILGRALAGVGKRDEAIKAYEASRDAAKGATLPTAEVLLELVPLYLQAGKSDEAVRAIELARDNVQATENLPTNTQNAQQNQQNAAAARIAKNLDPVIRRNRALAYMMHGYESVQKKNADAGVADLQKALEGGLEGKEKANATCALALGLLGSNKAGQAVQSFQAAQKMGGCDFKAPYDKLGLDYWIAYARYREGTPAGLNDALKVFAKTQPKATGDMVDKIKEMTFTAYLKLMAEEYARGNTAGSMAALKNAQKAAVGVKDDVRKRDLQHNLAVLDLASGKTAQAKQQLEQLGARPPEALVNLGLIYEKQGDIQRALQLWQQSGRGGKVREWIDATRRFLGVGGGGAGGGGAP
jgi:tetratricopeptide (TPR) repeat protein